MPRVTHVKKAQQRYATKPVLDADGNQVKVPVIDKRTGEQKVTKGGRPVFLRPSQRDLERPLPMPTCDAPTCGEPSREIAVGTPYKWIEPSGQSVRTRHEDCPTWNVWEYSSSLSARVAQIQSDGPDDDFDSVEDAQAWAQGKAEEIRELAEEKRESASNMEEGFGHATSMSDELNETADSLDGWANGMENVDLPSLPEPEEEDCEDCGGGGSKSEDSGEDEDCDTCGGTGKVTEDEPTAEQMDEWRDEVRDALENALDESPV